MGGHRGELGEGGGVSAGNKQESGAGDLYSDAARQMGFAVRSATLIQSYAHTHIYTPAHPHTPRVAAAWGVGGGGGVGKRKINTEESEKGREATVHDEAVRAKADEEHAMHQLFRARYMYDL